MPVPTLNQISKDFFGVSYKQLNLIKQRMIRDLQRVRAERERIGWSFRGRAEGERIGQRKMRMRG